MARGSTSRSTEDDDTLVVGVVRGPHGLGGEVRVEPLTDRFEERFRPGSKLRSPLGEVTIISVRGSAGQPIVRFEGIADRAAAEKLRGDLRIPRSAARRPDEHLWADLVGTRVRTPDGAELGEVVDVLRAGGADVLVVRDGAREVLLPMIDTVIREIGPEGIVAVPQEEA